uniref:Uncharacterized protein n=1 Tax=Arundo donax TaxID=35708 RepID=A0A0A9ED54_ARUDO
MCLRKDQFVSCPKKLEETFRAHPQPANPREKAKQLPTKSQAQSRTSQPAKNKKKNQRSRGVATSQSQLFHKSTVTGPNIRRTPRKRKGAQECRKGVEMVGSSKKSGEVTSQP